MKKSIYIFVVMLALTKLNAMEQRPEKNAHLEENSQEISEWKQLPNHLKWEALSLTNYDALLYFFTQHDLRKEFFNDQAFLKDLAHNLFINNPKNAKDLLIEAAQNENKKLVSALINEDASLEKYAINVFVNRKFSPQFNEDAFNTLLQAGIDINAQYSGGYSGLMEALFQDDREKALWFLDHGADIYQKDSQGRTFLNHLDNYIQFPDITSEREVEHNRFWSNLRERAIDRTL